MFMKKQDKSSGKKTFPASVLRDLQSAYRMLERASRAHPWLVLGTVNVIAPKSPSGSVLYTWTRKVRAKTVTVALSQKQAVAFRRAIAVNRRIEDALSRLREVSQAALRLSLPGVTKLRLNRSAGKGSKIVQKGA